jgi:hypothetical protein
MKRVMNAEIGHLMDHIERPNLDGGNVPIK